MLVRGHRRDQRPSIFGSARRGCRYSRAGDCAIRQATWVRCQSWSRSPRFCPRWTLSTTVVTRRAMTCPESGRRSRSTLRRQRSGCRNQRETRGARCLRGAGVFQNWTGSSDKRIGQDAAPSATARGSGEAAIALHATEARAAGVEWPHIERHNCR